MSNVESFEIKNNILVKCLDKQLTDVIIPDGVTSIGNSAFRGCTSLTNITIPDSVTSIGDYAFEGCTSLTNITIPDGVTSIGIYAFCSCKKLTDINIPDGVTNIVDSDAFCKCPGLADKKGFVIIKNMLFGYFGEKSDIVIPKGVTTICSGAFAENQTIKSVKIPASVTTIGSEVFHENRKLKELYIPDSVVEFNSNNFCLCLKSLVIYGKKGSVAEEIAEDNSIKFKTVKK